MKICWDNLEGLRYNRERGIWRNGKNKYFVYEEKCVGCGEPFLRNYYSNGKYCCMECYRLNHYGENCYWYGKKNPASEEKKRKISKIMKDMRIDSKSVFNSDEFRNKMSISIKRLWDDPNSVFNSDEYKRIMASRKLGLSKDKNPRWNGGYTSKNIPTYDVYAPQLEWCEEVRRNEEDPNVLEVKCFKCDKWFIPKLRAVTHRIQALKEQITGYQTFYCSDDCKNSCSIFGKSPEQLMKEDAIRAGRLQWLELNREVQPELRQMVLERDGYECVKCGSKEPLHCHHILPVATNPLLSADVDNCITLCEECHREVHKLPGCGYNEIKIEVC